MSLNKHTGLYSIPSHHLHGAKPAPRPTFNSMDFAGEEAGSSNAGGKSLPQVKQGEYAVTSQQEQKRKKKRSMSKEDTQDLSTHTPVSFTPLITVTPATGSSKGKNDKSTASPDKKRKRKSDNQSDHASLLRRSSSTDGYFVSTDMLQDVQSSVRSAGEVFSSPRAGDDSTEQPSKKKSKKNKTSRKSNDTIDFDRMAKETRAIDKKARREKKMKRRNAEAARAHVPVGSSAPVPSPPIFSSPRPRKTPIPIPPNPFLRRKDGITESERAMNKEIKTEKGWKQRSDEAGSTPAVASSRPPLRKTPVPLPQNAFTHAVNATKVDRVGCRDSRLLVVDTPPSQVPKTPIDLPDSPIPFKLTDAIKAKRDKSSKKVNDSSVLAEPLSSAPPARSKNPKLELRPDGEGSVTTSNLVKYVTTTQPLSEKAEPKLKTPDKPFSRCASKQDQPSPLETHAEADAATFTPLYLAVQRVVNFTAETSYLQQATEWRKANTSRGPLPCLGQKASGCNTKREKLLRLTQDDGPLQVKSAVANASNVATILADAKQRADAAEAVLSLAIKARVPIPLGAIEGKWSLFCPEYAESHRDKYSDGQRSLHILPLASTTSTTSATSSLPSHPDTYTDTDTDSHTNAYTAHLTIPPRSMQYPLHPFSAPPHASFRTITLKTAVEGYEMGVLFLGNGYLVLRVDLRLLLSGEEGRVMEFVGVREGAVVWG